MVKVITMLKCYGTPPFYYYLWQYRTLNETFNETFAETIDVTLDAEAKSAMVRNME
jgi:hypothetical protein